MTVFSSTRRDVADVPHSVDAVWQILVDPDEVARLTPLVASIDVDERGRWVWSLRRVPLPGRRFDLTMVEEMRFAPQRRIDFSHGPLGERIEAGAEGYYLLEPLPGGTRLTIELTVSAQLPLPAITRRAVELTMHRVLDHMGHRFSAGMLRELSRREASPR